MSKLHRTIAGLLVVGSMALSQIASAQDVDELFAQGTAALETGKHADALRAFEAVWKQRKTYDVAANLAQAEMELSKHRDAAEHFAYALRNFPVTGKTSLRTEMESLLVEAKTHVVTLRIRTNVEKAEVSVNGQRAGVAPIAEEVFADAGAVTVEAGRDGYQAAKLSFEAKQGETRDVDLTLVATSIEPGAGPRKEILIAGAAVSGAALVTGIVLVALSGVKAGEADKLRAELVTSNGRKACEPPSSLAGCKSVQSALDARDTLGNVGGWALVGAGAAALGTAGYFLATRERGSSVQAALTVAPGHAGLVIRGAW